MNKILFLAAMLGFFVAVAIVLVRRNFNDASKINLDDLVLDRYGRMDVPVCAFWLCIGVMCLVLVYCLLKGKVPDGIAALYGTFATACVGPLIVKVIFKGKPLPELPKASTDQEAGK